MTAKNTSRMPQDTAGSPIPILGFEEGPTAVVLSSAAVTFAATANTITIDAGAWARIPLVGDVITVASAVDAQNNDGFYVLAATSTVITVNRPLAAQAADTVSITLHLNGRRSGVLTLTSGAATYIYGLKPGEVYHFSVALSSDLIDGIPDNVYVRPGGMVTSAPVTTASFLQQASKYPQFKIPLLDDQQSIGFLSTDTNTLYISWVRLS